MSTPDDEVVAALLGRKPQGAYRVVVRDRTGQPVVIENDPLLDDGTPMPTAFWLLSGDVHYRVSQLESSGGVNRAEEELGLEVIAAAHDAYRKYRDAKLEASHTGISPSGGVGGTRTGVKCLHAHTAWWLAGGDDPVGEWVANEINLPRPINGVLL
jgi:uncharacterized protein